MTRAHARRTHEMWGQIIRGLQTGTTPLTVLSRPKRRVFLILRGVLEPRPALTLLRAAAIRGTGPPGLFSAGLRVPICKRMWIFRSVACTLAMAALGAVIAGCGSSTVTSTDTAAQPASATPLTKTDAAAFAHEVNLKPSDVPGMASTSSEREGKQPGAHAARLCGVEALHDNVAYIHSPSFKSGKGLRITEIASDVAVAPTSLFADRLLAEARAEDSNPVTRACLEKVYARAFAKGSKRSSTSLVHLRLGRASTLAVQPATHRSFGLRIEIPLSITFGGASGVIRDDIQVELLGFVSGRAEVALSALTSGARLSATNNDRLLSLLYRRATAHSL
jgi:hypothetical protein